MGQDYIRPEEHLLYLNLTRLYLEEGLKNKGSLANNLKIR
jgi:hypothetical protein